jgi:hypothetical protein
MKEKAVTEKEIKCSMSRQLGLGFIFLLLLMDLVYLINFHFTRQEWQLMAMVLIFEYSLVSSGR